ncbi:hypothetical protein MTO96_029054 [Rhipicephalus appendiculatus]
MERLLRRRKCLRSQLDAIAQEAEGLLREPQLSSSQGSGPIQPPQSACSGHLPVNDPGTWDAHTGRLDPRPTRSGRRPLECRRHQQEPSSMLPVCRVGATTRASAQAGHRGNDQGRLWYRNTCCGSSVGYGSSSRAARRAAEGSKPGVLVFTSSSRQEAKPRETFDKATYAQREKAASFLARTTARGTSNEPSCKVHPAR